MPRKGEKMTPEHRQKITEARMRRPQHDDAWYMQSAEKRFAKSIRSGPMPDFRPELGPCLIFTGATNTGGYGQFRFNQRNGYAHRYAWERVNGPIPDGMTIDHLCRVRRCVNVDHLEVVDGITNYLRGVEARNCCPNGHAYTEDNTVRHRNGVRRCRICQKRQHEAQKRKRSRSLNGLPNRRIKYDQAKVRRLIVEIRAGAVSIAQAAREVGCNSNYLGRRVWEETRRDVLKRDSSLCVMCGAGADEVHHRRPRGIGGTRDPLVAYGMGNLVSLCRDCHSGAESQRAKARDLGWLIPHGEADPERTPVLHWRLGPVLLGHDGGITPVGRAA